MLVEIKLKCVEDTNECVDREMDLDLKPGHLISGKEYLSEEIEVMDFEHPSECYYLISNEFGYKFWYSSRRFETTKKGS